MNEDRLDYLASIFVKRKVRQAFHIPFEQFINYINTGRWKVLADETILIVY